MGKTAEVWRHCGPGILAGRGTVRCLSPDCSLSGRLREVMLGGGWADLTAMVSPDLWLEEDGASSPISPGNCSVPEGGEQGFGKRERSRDPVKN